MEFLKKEIVSWSLQNILLSMLPFILGATFRVIYSGKLFFNALDPSELSFSMAILFILILQSVGGLDDDNLKRSLSVLIQLGIFFALTLFATSLILKIHLDSQMTTAFNNFIELSKNKPSEISGVIEAYNNDSFHNILLRLNWASIGLTILGIPLIIVMKDRYNLT